MKVFDKGIIEGFTIDVDLKIIDNAVFNLTAILDNALSDLKKNNAFIVGIGEIVLINEFYTGAISSNSTIDVFLVLTSSQLELNSITFTKKRFKNFFSRLKLAYKDQKVSKKKKRWWRKKTRNNFDENLLKTYDIIKYNMYDFNRDLVKMIARYITKTTICSLEKGVIIINGDSLPFKARIFPVINKFGSYNFFSETNGKFINYDLKKRFENINILIENFGNKFISLLKIFNGVYFNIYNSPPPQIFIESLIFNLPKEAFVKDTNFECFLYAVNFLNNTNPLSLNSIADAKKRIYQDQFCGADISKVNDFLSKIKKYSN